MGTCTRVPELGQGAGLVWVPAYSFGVTSQPAQEGALLAAHTSSQARATPSRCRSESFGVSVGRGGLSWVWKCQTTPPAPEGLANPGRNEGPTTTADAEARGGEGGNTGGAAHPEHWGSPPGCTGGALTAARCSGCETPAAGGQADPCPLKGLKNAGPLPLLTMASERAIVFAHRTFPFFFKLPGFRVSLSGTSHKQPN